MDCDRLALENLWKQAQSDPINFFAIYPITENSYITCPRQLREQYRNKFSKHLQATGKQPVHVEDATF